MPYRAYSRRSGPGAHQLARPSSRMVAGTSSIRTTVASTTIAMIIATPIILMNVMPDSENAPITTSISSAALVMMPPVRCRPVATAAVLSPVRSYCSRMRDMQEDLVVHRQPEHDRQHQDRLRRLDRARSA